MSSIFRNFTVQEFNRYINYIPEKTNQQILEEHLKLQKGLEQHNARQKKKKKFQSLDELEEHVSWFLKELRVHPPNNTLRCLEQNIFWDIIYSLDHVDTENTNFLK